MRTSLYESNPVPDLYNSTTAPPIAFMNDVVNALIGPDPELFSRPGSNNPNWPLVEGLLQTRLNASLQNAVFTPGENFIDVLQVLINPTTSRPFLSRQSFILYLLNVKYACFLYDNDTWHDTGLANDFSLSFRFSGQALDHVPSARAFAVNLSLVQPRA